MLVLDDGLIDLGEHLRHQSELFFSRKISEL